MSQGELAEKVGVSVPSIVSWEKDITKATVKHLLKLADALEIGIEDIILSEA